MSKRTLGGTNRKAIRVSGFRARMKTHTGKNIIKSGNHFINSFN